MDLSVFIVAFLLFSAFMVINSRYIVTQRGEYYRTVGILQKSHLTTAIVYDDKGDLLLIEVRRYLGKSGQEIGHTLGEKKVYIKRDRGFHGRGWYGLSDGNNKPEQLENILKDLNIPLNRIQRPL